LNYIIRKARELEAKGMLLTPNSKPAKMLKDGYCEA
jgi:hypothetical protein